MYRRSRGCSSGLKPVRNIERRRTPRPPRGPPGMSLQTPRFTSLSSARAREGPAPGSIVLAGEGHSKLCRPCGLARWEFLATL